MCLIVLTECLPDPVIHGGSILTSTVNISKFASDEVVVISCGYVGFASETPTIVLRRMRLRKSLEHHFKLLPFCCRLCRQERQFLTPVRHAVDAVEAMSGL